MKFALSLLLLVPLAAQTLTLTGPTNVRPGQSVAIDLALGGSAAPVGLQWSLAMPAGITATATAGAGLGTAKTLHCQAPICLAVGLNVTPIVPGVVARYSVQVAPTAAKGVYQLPLTGLLAANADGEAIVLTSGPAYSLRVLARSDINGDGLTNGVDLGLMIDQVLGRAACADDQTGDGKCDLLDVLAIVRDALQ